jgi:MinD-like ATPase involved in chromosome partitioning or flagellar assembly
VVVSAQLDALRSFVARRPAAAAAPDDGGAQVLVVGSGKGGAGTSVVAALTALAAAAEGRRVLLVDADPHVGPQRFLLGLAASPSIADLRAGADLAALAVPVSATLAVIPGGPGLAGAPSLDPAEQRALLRRVATLYPQHDLIVLDGGSRLDAVCACCESAAGTNPVRLLVVTDTDPIALAASYALVKASRERTAALPGGSVECDVIVNRHDEDAAALGFAQIAQASADFLGAAVRHAGTIPDDGSLALALRAGMPLQDAAAGSPAAVAAHALVEQLLAHLAGAHTTGSDRPHVASAPQARRPMGGTYAPPFRSSAVPSGALR